MQVKIVITATGRTIEVDLDTARRMILSDHARLAPGQGREVSEAVFPPVQCLPKERK